MSTDRKGLLMELMEVRYGKNQWFVCFDVAFKELDAAEAAWQPPGRGNTIWQIVNHLAFWNEDALYRLKGETSPNPFSNNDDTFGLPGDATDEEGWRTTVQRLKDTFDKLLACVERMNEVDLDVPYREGAPTKAKLLGNIAMHDTYHLGQIVMLRKLRESWPGFDWE